jgi:hypothetical protein
MLQDEAARADVAKRTVDLLIAYCATLDIAPAELPHLVTYVADVLSRNPKPQFCPVRDKFVFSDLGAEDRVTVEVPWCGEVIDLAEYRARL